MVDFKFFCLKFKVNINVTPFNPKDEDFDETGLRSYHLTFQLEELCPKLFVFHE